LYCQLLKQAVAQLKGDKRGWRVEVDLRLDFVATNEAEFAQFGPEERVPAFIPISYIADTALRIQAYRHLAEITTHEQLRRVRKEWRDRFGKPASAIDNLLLLTEDQARRRQSQGDPGGSARAQADADPARGFYTCGGANSLV